MFYDIFLKLCKQKGVTPSAVMRAIGLNKSSASYWKKGVTPSSDTLRKLADYFNVSMDYLLGNVWNPKHVLSESSALGVTAYTVLPDNVQAEQHKDDFEEDLKKLSDTARSALKSPKITEPKEQLFNILEELSYEDLEALVKFAQFTKYQRQEAQEPREPSPAPPEGKDTTPPPEGTERPTGGSETPQEGE